MPTPTPPDAAEVIRLWPDGPPTALDGVGEEIAYEVRSGAAVGTTFIRNISDPTLTVFTPRAGRANGAAAIVVPGGGWTISAWVHEGLDVARWLAGAGYVTFLLKYRVQGSGDDQERFEQRMAAMDSALAAPVPAASLPRAIGDLVSTPEYHAARGAAADDGRRAIAVVREHAARFGVDPAKVGMIGFSAGAFLTADIAIDTGGAAPLAWVAAMYGGETRGAPVPADAPPLFTSVARDDLLCRIVEDLHAEWAGSDRPSELHVFRRGGHGFGMVRQGTPSDRWPELFLDWLADLA